MPGHARICQSTAEPWNWSKGAACGKGRWQPCQCLLNRLSFDMLHHHHHLFAGQTPPEAQRQHSSAHLLAALVCPVPLAVASALPCCCTTAAASRTAPAAAALLAPPTADGLEGATAARQARLAGGCLGSGGGAPTSYSRELLAVVDKHWLAVPVGRAHARPGKIEAAAGEQARRDAGRKGPLMRRVAGAMLCHAHCRAQCSTQEGGYKATLFMPML